MKNVKSILNHIFPNPKKLDEHRCFNKIISLFPDRFKKHILFCYIKNRTLFFVLDHPAIKMEFNCNQNLINELLNIAKTKTIECKNIEIESFKYFVSNKNIQKNINFSKNLNSYKEKSKGNFKIFSKRPEIEKIFKSIKEEIKKIKENEKRVN